MTLTEITPAAGRAGHASTAAERARSAAARHTAVVDVMGGINERSGGVSLVCTLPMMTTVTIGEDGSHTVQVRRGGASSDGARKCALPLDDVIGRGAAFDIGRFFESVRQRDAEWAWPSLAAIHVAAEQAGRGNGLDGLTIDIKETNASSPSAGMPSAMAAATLDAAFSCWGNAGESSQRMAGLERLAEWPALSGAGLRGLTAGKAGHVRRLMQMQRDSSHAPAALELPPGVTIAVIEVTPQRPIRAERMMESDLAATMGHRLIVELARLDGCTTDPTHGRLSTMPHTEYVANYRDRLIAKIPGKLFQQKFAHLCDGLTGIVPTQSYKPRSRAEHHIYENQRVRDFCSSIVRAARASDHAPLVEAGELMYASHWSQSQRYGLGSVETDALTQLVRERGPANGFYGARLAAIEPTVAAVVLLSTSAAQSGALDEIASEITRKYGGAARCVTTIG